jgi:hypothetical protein
MKKLLVLLFSIFIFPLSLYASDVYYCSDDSLTGFTPATNYKQQNFNEEKFKIMIDFENKNVVSEKLYLGGIWDQKCWYDKMDSTLYCMNQVGRAFSINKLNLRYFRSNIYNRVDLKDHIWIGYGTCEKF